MEGDTSFGQSLAIQWRVIRALLMREIITRYGRHNLGFFWVFCEPMLFCVGITEVWTHFHKTAGRGLSVAAFAITGYSTILLWRNVGNKCGTAVTPNLSLLYHRNVRVIDILVARIILEISGCLMAFYLQVIFFVAVGFLKPPADWSLLMAGYLIMAWFAGSLGIFVCACSELSDVFERLWHPFTYFMLPISGLPFMVEWLPLKYQKLALWVPMINGVEMMRDGYFGYAVHTYYSVPYLASWCVALMLVGLTFLKLFARRVEPQ